MKTRRLLVCILALVFACTWLVSAEEDMEGPTVANQTSPTRQKELNVPLLADPVTLDPALATDSESVSVIDQLFIGLVDLDDDTAEVEPGLATDWTVSPDNTVYTFTLRSDVTWSDGTPVTAYHVEYGILRTLDPATGSDYAYVLFPIENAVSYNLGGVTDPDLVGVKALGDWKLRITLREPASQILSILSMWVARPMPQWSIDAYGSAWTDRSNIVTNGAYELTEWHAGDRILLTKNPTYFNAAGVGVERVKMWIVPQVSTQYQMYLDGALDTAEVALSEMNGIRSDPILSQEFTIAPNQCTYYYGFSVSEPPFDDPLVRKAFAAASNRRALISEVTQGAQTPALTYTPPGVFGHVDGYAEDVGIPYSPTQARQWLAQAGYPDGEGLPPVTIWHNTSAAHQAIAYHIKDNWEDTLGVSVSVDDLQWGTYLDELEKGELQVFRLGWCSDYFDAYNFLHDGVRPRRFGNWDNSTYWSLLDQASREQNQESRKQMFKQAEEILVETDAVMLPLYHYGKPVLTKPYVERSYGYGFGQFANWQLTYTSNVVDPSGGVLASYRGDTTLHIPAGAFTETVVLTHTPASGVPPGGDLHDFGSVFDVTAAYSDTGQAAQIVPGQAVTMSFQYTDTTIGPTIEDTLSLYRWDEAGEVWSQEGITSTVSVTKSTVTARVAHLSRFAVLGETKRVFLPLALKRH